MLKIESGVSRQGHPVHTLVLKVRDRYFSPSQFSDRLTAERAHDALLVYFSDNDVILEGVPINAEFHKSLSDRLLREPLAKIIGVPGDKRGERFTSRINTIIAYAHNS